MALFSSAKSLKANKAKKRATPRSSEAQGEAMEWTQHELDGITLTLVSILTAEFAPIRNIKAPLDDLQKSMLLTDSKIDVVVALDNFGVCHAQKYIDRAVMALRRAFVVSDRSLWTYLGESGVSLQLTHPAHESGRRRPPPISTDLFFTGDPDEDPGQVNSADAYFPFYHLGQTRYVVTKKVECPALPGLMMIVKIISKDLQGGGWNEYPSGGPSSYFISLLCIAMVESGREHPESAAVGLQQLRRFMTNRRLVRAFYCPVVPSRCESVSLADWELLSVSLDSPKYRYLATSLVLEETLSTKMGGQKM